jgi:ATP diphosphatase
VTDKPYGEAGDIPIDELLKIMARLRDPQTGCPWDREQDFSTIAPHTIEEAYEVADAIARHDNPGLREELGDLLFQVVFHAQMAREAGYFGFPDVVQTICDKMRRRHPHVFGNEKIETAAEQIQAWEAHKAQERRQKSQDQAANAGLLDHVPLALPALTRANKLGKRAAMVGFEWPNWQGAREKIGEELAELDAALAQNAPTEHLKHELGDLLFTVVNLARYLKIDPEGALRACNERFTARFRYIENRLRERGLEPSQVDLATLDALWIEAKGAL